MRKEYKFWIVQNLNDFRCRDSITLNLWDSHDLNKVLEHFTDEDYETVSDKLTDAIEKFLIIHNVPLTYAIRYSWKWSD